MKRMMDNIKKTKQEMWHRKYQIARSRLSLKRFRQQKNFTIDVNVNIKK